MTFHAINIHLFLYKTPHGPLVVAHCMSVKCNGALEVLQAELADVNLGEGGKVRRVG